MSMPRILEMRAMSSTPSTLSCQLISRPPSRPPDAEVVVFLDPLVALLDDPGRLLREEGRDLSSYSRRLLGFERIS